MSVSGPSVDLAPEDDSGGADVEDEEAPEPTGPLGPEAFQTTADPAMFQNTYLAFQDDWAIAEPTPSPAPYPLQVIPRVAYTINFNMIWDPAQQKWVPDEGNEQTGTSLSYPFRAQVDAFTNLDITSGAFNDTTVPLVTNYGGAFDPDDLIDETDDVWVCPEDGQYFFSWNMAFAAATTSQEYECYLEHVGIRNHGFMIVFADQDSPTFSATATIDLDAGDEVRLRMGHDSPNTETIEDDEQETHFAGFQIAAGAP